jgi:hypothetical protein
VAVAIAAPSPLYRISPIISTRYRRWAVSPEEKHRHPSEYLKARPQAALSLFAEMGLLDPFSFGSLKGENPTGDELTVWGVT